MKTLDTLPYHGSLECWKLLGLRKNVSKSPRVLGSRHVNSSNNRNLTMFPKPPPFIISMMWLPWICLKLSFLGESWKCWTSLIWPPISRCMFPYGKELKSKGLGRHTGVSGNVGWGPPKRWLPMVGESLDKSGRICCLGTGQYMRLQQPTVRGRTEYANGQEQLGRRLFKKGYWKLTPKVKRKPKSLPTK